MLMGERAILIKRREYTNMDKNSYEKKIQSLEEEIKIMEQAKTLLMEQNHMTEEEAHRYIQKRSMDNGTGMVETAEMILSLMRG